MTTEPTPIQVSTASLSESRWKTGELYVYRHVIRCPLCDRDWCFEAAAPRGAINPQVDPASIGPGLLCGVCAAQRIAVAVFPVEGGKATMRKFWTDQDEAIIWGRCKGHHRAQYAPRITRGGLWDRATPLLDEREDAMRTILDIGGRRVPGITPKRLQRLGLNWRAGDE